MFMIPYLDQKRYPSDGCSISVSPPVMEPTMLVHLSESAQQSRRREEFCDVTGKVGDLKFCGSRTQFIVRFHTDEAQAYQRSDLCR